MRILFDFSLASDDAGGPRTLMDGLLRGWQQAFPEDVLAVYGPADFRSQIGPDVDLIEPKLGIPPRRIVQQQFELPLMHRSALRAAEVVVVPNIGCSLLPLGAPVVGTLCDLKHLRRSAEFGRSAKLFRRFLWPAASRKMSAVVSISRFSLDEAHDLGFPLPEIQAVAPLGIDHVPATGAGPRSKRNQVVCVAHRATKATGDLATAWRAVERSLEDCPRLVVTGVPTGPVRDAINRGFEDFGLSTRPDFLPYLPTSELYETIAASRALLYLSNYEGYGLVPSEASALGTRSFTYDLPPYRERDGGLLLSTVPAGDADGLGSELAAFLRAPMVAEAAPAAQPWCTTAAVYRAVADQVRGAR